MKHYLYKFKGMLFINILVILVSSGLDVLLALVLKSLVDLSTGGNTDTFLKTLVSSIGFIIILVAASFIQKIMQSAFIKRIMVSIKDDIFNSILNRDMRSFNDENSAQYISILNNDMVILEQDYFINILGIIGHVFSFALGTYLLISLSPYIALGTFILGIVPLFIPAFFGKRLEILKEGYSDSMGSFTTKVKDIFSGFEVIKNFHIEQRIADDFKRSNYQSENSKYKFNKFNSQVESISSLFGNMMFIVALGIGTYLAIQGSITVGAMIAAVQLMNNIVNPIVNVSFKMSKIKSVRLIGEKISRMMSEEKCLDDGEALTSFHNSIEFRDVEFSYNDERKALKGVCFNIVKGCKYAIIGGSGSGKSTIIKLLLRYYENFAGTISIDGRDVREIRVSDLYNLVSVIQQNVFMFDSTIKENISLYHEYGDDDIDSAVAMSGLYSLVGSLPMGKDSPVGENGCNLSGGERQRIAIARAIIKKTPVMVLDEATSALDNETAYNIESAILGLKDVTALVVTHKLSPELLSMYDGIIVVRDGVVVEQGTFDELLRGRSYFYNLYSIEAA